MKELKGQECSIINPIELIKSLEYEKGANMLNQKIENEIQIESNNKYIGMENDR